MTGASWDIDAIVREVLRRLDHPQVAGGAPAPAPVADPATLHLQQRVVTLVGLADRLSGVRRVLLPPGAVVTPAVRDEFRRRGIRMESAPAEAGPGTASESALIVAMDSSPPPQTLWDTVAAAAGAVRTLGPTPLAELIPHLAETIGEPPRAALLITGQPAAALCLANRYPRLRAVASAGEPESFRQAVETIGANVLVLDSDQPAGGELHRSIRHFRQTRHICPPRWKQILEDPP